MIDTELVADRLKALGSFDDETIESYDELIENAALSVYATLKSMDYEDDGRVIFLAAAKAYYYIACSGGGFDSVESFKAGDVTLQENPKALIDVAELIVKQAQADCAGLIYGSGFAFRGV
ncbi:MAG: hypothetical protein LUH82_05120 [Clostridiales bacterium]|nr:hypothetical protein [Clostridiales bacterium]